MVELAKSAGSPELACFVEEEVLDFECVELLLGEVFPLFQNLWSENAGLKLGGCSRCNLSRKLCSKLRLAGLHVAGSGGTVAEEELQGQSASDKKRSCFQGFKTCFLS